MQTGVVKWFNNAKGYGFILSDDAHIDIFAHYSAIEMDGYRTLKAGQCVSFEAVDGAKGLHASNIALLEDVKIPSDNLIDKHDAQSSAETKPIEDVAAIT